MSETETLLKLPDVLKQIPVSRSTWLLGVNAGIYPRPIQIGPRAVAWRQSDLETLKREGISKPAAGDAQ